MGHIANPSNNNHNKIRFMESYTKNLVSGSQNIFRLETKFQSSITLHVHYTAIFVTPPPPN